MKAVDDLQIKNTNINTKNKVVKIQPEENNRLVSAGLSVPRKGWEEASMLMNKNGDDTLLIDDSFSDNDFIEWI